MLREKREQALKLFEKSEKGRPCNIPLSKYFKRFSKKGESLGAYGYRTKILNVVIRGMAEHNKEAEWNVWIRFKRGLFTGEIMHLRNIERTFGKGSLRLVASLCSGTKEELDIEKTYNKIVDYLETDDEEKRDKIAEEILVDREYKEYKKQRGGKNNGKS